MDPRLLCVMTEVFFCSADSPSYVASTYLIIQFSTRPTFLPRTFNPADYAEQAHSEENYRGGSTWNNTGSAELEEGASKLIY